MEDTAIREHSEGTIISVRVHTSSSRHGLDATGEERIEVYVHSPPERGKANNEALKIISKALGVPASHLELLKGRASRNKTLLARGITPSQTRIRLDLP